MQPPEVLGAYVHPMTPHCPPDPQHGGDLLPPYPWPEEDPNFGTGCPPGPFVPPPPALLPGDVGGTHGTPELPPAPQTGPPLGPPTACPMAPLEHGTPNLLISPHMLPCEERGALGWGGWTWVAMGVGWPWGGWMGWPWV